MRDMRHLPCDVIRALCSHENIVCNVWANELEDETRVDTTDRRLSTRRNTGDSWRVKTEGILDEV